MAEGDWGKRDSHGEWLPDVLPKPSPLFSLPWKPLRILKYLFGWMSFYVPYNLFYALLAIVIWLFFTPSMARTTRFEIGWIAEIYLRNAVLLILISGVLHLRLYTTRGQGTKFKYTNKWLATNDSKFLFRNQTFDNVFWNFVSGCVIWTAYEAVTLWAFSNHIIPYVDWRAHPVYFVLILLAVPYLRVTHFYWTHLLTHWRPLYRISHYLHHKNINIGPWSGLTMHPIEHLIYFSGVLLHWVIPSHPIHAIYHLIHAGVTPAVGHTGFNRFVMRGERGLANDNFFHYLHHRFFTVNYGNESVPLDKWFGSFHDGSPEAHAAMLARRKKAPRPVA